LFYGGEKTIILLLKKNKMFYKIIKILLGPLVRLFWVKRVEGLENIPKKGPFIFAANHSSYFDFICMIAIAPRPVYFLAAEVFYKSFFWKPIMLATGQVRVDRSSKDKNAVFESAKKILSDGKILGVFPEGTRSRSGKIQKAYSGVARIAKDNKVNIVPVAIKGTFGIMTPYEKMPHFRKIAEYKFLKPIKLENTTKSDDEIVQKELMPLIAKEVGEDYSW
jgi:1-acyl-sn-glycerol-3-phosphate acyltransferase